MDNTITYMVVDDYEIDRLMLASFLHDYPFMKCQAVFDSPLPALDAARAQAPDVLFVDIDMPAMNGLELRRQLLHIPACIFITSYPDYALEAFDMAALDFLLKPLTAERFSKTMERVAEHATVRQKARLLEHTLGADTIFIKDGIEQIKLHLSDIIYLEALKDYTRIVTATKKYSVLSPLGTLIKEKTFSSFVRIHRSYAVQKHFIQKMTSVEIQVHDIVLPVGRSFKDALKALTS
ncbi:LytTR family DNA-binding domain-containing protein [Ferruginibacter sp. HRS2-29]|uniref:LytR/AlgR family response regulator transcription factor n=1 Tax=Ferruginibacter sp. HRS2-29 TaxID=2487334 RepID=UPI0020CCEEA1|nr:LytTR family DNA-binding domain-containing protein [Ferruginibacter sp. HRS2-29]MCP9751803.1 DNA-binding response regulator [Ferruginibacter sp. HRS2-29]